MARPASQATAGYFPTPEHLLPALAALVALPPDRCYRPLFLDPCAGTGTALLGIAAALLGTSRDRAADSCLAVELEATRARRLARRLPEGAAFHADAFHVGLTATPGASVVFLNPPYDHDPEHGRLEQRFLARFTLALAPGGALLFVVPHTSLGASADHLAAHYSDVHVMRFPDDDFATYRQVVVVAKRRPEPIPPDRFTARRLAHAAMAADGLPVLGAGDAVPLVTVDVPSPSLVLHPHAVDVEGLLARCRPFRASTALLGFDRDCRRLLGAPLQVALPPRPAHIALAMAGGLLNGRRVEANDPSRFPDLLVKGSFVRTLQRVGVRRNRDGDVVGEVCVQQPRLDVHVLRLDTYTFHRLALGTAPSGASRIERFNSADLFDAYSAALARLVREQLPALHDPDEPAHRIELPALARKPFRAQAASIQAGLKLLATRRNPQALAEVGTGKSTVALSIAAALGPEHFARTTAELARVGFDTRHLRPIRRLLVLCPPHLLGSWVDQARAVLPDAPVQVVEKPSDLDRRARIYVLSRETAKLGSTVAGVRGHRCPDCGHPLPDVERPTLAARRLRCDREVIVPADEPAAIARDVALAVYRYLPAETMERLLPYLEAHPVAHRRALDRTERDDAAERLPVAPSPALVAATERLMAWVERVRPVGLQGLLADRFATLGRDQLVLALDHLLAVARWHARPGCGGALHAVTGEPRRVPLARYVLKKRRRRFDLLLLDEAHEFSTRGSAQQKAAHRLVELPGVPTITLTGSLMGGYASSLFTNTWALSRSFRGEFGHDEQAPFVARYGYRKFLVSTDTTRPLRGPRSFGRQTDRSDDGTPAVRQLGEAPGVLPLFVLERLLPTALVMHKADLDDELPPLSEVPVPVRPPASDELAAKLLAEYGRLRSELVARIQEDRGTDRAGLLWGAMSELPSYLDLASADCGDFTLAYPEDAGGEVIATGAAFPSDWKLPKERWLVSEIAGELAAGRRVLVFLRHTGRRAFVERLHRLVLEDTGADSRFLDPSRVPTRRRERWLDRIVAEGCRVLLVHPRAVQTGLNNLTAFATAVWYEGPDYDARVTRQGNGRPHRIGQTVPVRILYPHYAGTLQETALDLVARKITASLQVDGLSLAGALEAAGALSDEDRLHADAALAFGEALYRAAAAHR